MKTIIIILITGALLWELIKPREEQYDPNQGPFKVGEVECDLCRHRWEAMHSNQGKVIKCPNCENMTGYTVITK